MKLLIAFLMAFSGFTALAKVSKEATKKETKHIRKIASDGKYPITDFSAQNGDGNMRITGEDAKRLYDFLDINPEPSAWSGDDSKTVVEKSKNFPGGSCSLEKVDPKNVNYICDIYFVRKGLNIP